jgi:hypothetical protein
MDSLYGGLFSSHLACEEGRVQDAKLLVDHGASMTVRNKVSLPFPASQWTMLAKESFCALALEGGLHIEDGLP